MMHGNSNIKKKMKIFIFSCTSHNCISSLTYKQRTPVPTFQFNLQILVATQATI